MNRFKVLSLNPFTSIAIFLLLANTLFVLLSLRNENSSPGQRLERTEILVRLPASERQQVRMPIPVQQTPLHLIAARTHPNATQPIAQQF